MMESSNVRARAHQEATRAVAVEAVLALAVPAAIPATATATATAASQLISLAYEKPSRVGLFFGDERFELCLRGRHRQPHMHQKQ